MSYIHMYISLYVCWHVGGAIIPPFGPESLGWRYWSKHVANIVADCVGTWWLWNDGCVCGILAQGRLSYGLGCRLVDEPALKLFRFSQPGLMAETTFVFFPEQGGLSKTGGDVYLGSPVGHEFLQGPSSQGFQWSLPRVLCVWISSYVGARWPWTIYIYIYYS